PQAVTGQLAERLNREDDYSRGGRRRRRGKNRPPTIERAVERFFTGVAFIFIAFAGRTWAPAGNIWWFWMFIPAAGLPSEGASSVRPSHAGGAKARRQLTPDCKML